MSGGVLPKWRVYSNGFTLIEMLAVIVVILLLAGITIKVMPMLLNKGGRAQGIAEMEAIKNALNEYNAEYGSYPPCTTVKYECESSTNQNPFFRAWLAARDDRTQPNFFTDVELGYKYGLFSYLWKREQSDQVHWYNEDTPRDKAAKDRFASYLALVKPVPGWSGYSADGFLGLPPDTGWTNMSFTITDPWDQEYRYESKPPYIKFRLWSTGPDKTEGTADDISVE